MLNLYALDALAIASNTNVYFNGTYNEVIRLLNGSTGAEEQVEIKELIKKVYPMIIDNAQKILEFSKG